MNPLVNTDLHTYLRELVDHHLPDKDGEDKDRAGKAKPSFHQMANTRPSKAKRGKTK